MRLPLTELASIGERCTAEEYNQIVCQKRMNPTQADEAKALEIARCMISNTYYQFAISSGQFNSPLKAREDAETRAQTLLDNMFEAATADLRTQLADAQAQLAEYEAFIHSAWCYGAFDGHPNLSPKANAVVAKRMTAAKAEMDSATRQPTQDKGY
jgi:hypothetical protein